MDFFHGAQLSDVIAFILTTFVGYGVKNIKELNENIKIIILRVDNHENHLDDHEIRIRAIEKP